MLAYTPAQILGTPHQQSDAWNARSSMSLATMAWTSCRVASSAGLDGAAIFPDGMISLREKKKKP